MNQDVFSIVMNYCEDKLSEKQIRDLVAALETKLLSARIEELGMLLDDTTNRQVNRVGIKVTAVKDRILTLKAKRKAE